MTHHHLHSSPKTCHWGFFEAKLKPVMTIASGDEVTIDTISGGPDVVPDRNSFHVPPELAEVHARNERMVSLRRSDSRSTMSISCSCSLLSGSS